MSIEQQAKPLAGEVAIVTGASSGIGAATARELASQGAKVVLAARREDKLNTLVLEIKQQGGEALAVPTDVAVSEQLSRLVEQTIQAYGRVDILVNNAGIGQGFQDGTTEDITRAVNVNLLSGILLTHEVLPGMRERRHGSIISVASVAGWLATDALYSGTKFGLRGFSRGLRRELQGSGISVSLVSPGFVRTNLTAHRKAKLPGPEVVAKAIAQLAQHPKREVIVPRSFGPVPFGYHIASTLELLAPWLLDLALQPRKKR
jgi:NAD(P)-dependent dehydrogenase (short-subunit alcohol dehydrogenase family)